VSLTRSVVLNLARLFKAGDERKKSRVALATPEKGRIQSSLRDNRRSALDPGVETPG
jgi:hypothetical protein